jgi:N-acyl-D-aspartate/D-glutamate deacylase
VLTEENCAVIVMLDVSVIQMVGDYLRPNKPPDGIEYVFVNRKLAHKDKKHIGAKSGRIIRPHKKGATQKRCQALFFYMGKKGAWHLF